MDLGDFYLQANMIFNDLIGILITKLIVLGG